MSLDTLVLGPVGIIALVVGITEAAKRIGINGKWSFVLALVIGGFLASYGEALALGVIPEAAGIAMQILVVGLGGGLAATGLYDLVTEDKIFAFLEDPGA